MGQAIERGKTTPSIRTIGQLAEALSVPASEFFTDKATKPAKAEDVILARMKTLAPKEREFLLGVIDLLQKR